MNDDLPHDARLELSVLGLALVDEASAETVASLPDELWHDEKSASVAKALRAAHKAGAVVDVAAIESALRHANAFQAVGGHGMLETLLCTAALPARLDAHLVTLRELAHARKVIVGARRAAAAAQKIRGDALASFVANELEIAGDVHGDAEPTDLNSALQAAYSRIAALASGEIAGGYEWGYPSLDRIALPMRGGQLIVLAARPSCGKTSLALNCALNVARAGGRVYFASLETQLIDLAMRVLSSEGDVNLASISRGKLSDRDWDNVLSGASRVSQLPLLIDDDYGLSLDVIARKAARLQRRGGLSLIVLDYLQLIEGGVSGRDNREREVAAVARGLKKLAKRLDVPVLALAQLNRESAKAGSEREPVMSDLRESGAIEQDADAILFMHRVGVAAGRVAIKVAKQKNGPKGSTWLRFSDSTVRFSDDGDDNGCPRDCEPAVAETPRAKLRAVSGAARETTRYDHAGDFDV